MIYEVAVNRTTMPMCSDRGQLPDHIASSVPAGWPSTKAVLLSQHPEYYCLKGQQKPSFSLLTSRALSRQAGPSEVCHHDHYLPERRRFLWISMVSVEKSGGVTLGRRVALTDFVSPLGVATHLQRGRGL